jgi:protocatechuate 3,4-dioxygenase beta subunit
MDSTRRTFLVATGTLATQAACGGLQAAQGGTSPTVPTVAPKSASLPRTPSGDLGPFYPIDPPLGTGADLTRVRSGGTQALGTVIEITGRVVFRDGTPQANARLEVWQANAAGRYAHPGDTRGDAPLDPNFQGYADLRADADGRFRFFTIRPGSYPIEGIFQRSPHIHFDIRGRDRRLVTQMYFSDTDASVFAQDKLLEHDLWGRTNPLPPAMFAHLQSSRDPQVVPYQFDIVL